MLQRFYLAGVSSFFTQSEWLIERLQSQKIYALESFWNSRQIEQMLEKHDGFKIFLDSGAYSWHSSLVSQGVEPSPEEEREYLDRYIAFIHKHKDRLWSYANLDVVGDPVRSKANMEYMESKGVQPMPVFHYSPKQGDRKVQEEHFAYLEHMIKNYEFIALGGGASEGLTGSKYMRRYGDPAFDMIDFLDKKTKVHGFGIASFQLIKRYPFYSVDSTTWIRLSAFGNIFVPCFDLKTKKYRYDAKPKTVYVSELGRYKHSAKGHYDYVLADEDKDYVLTYLEHIDIKMDDCEKSYLARQRVNVLYYEKFVEHMQNVEDIKNKKDQSFF
jgi:hypothetical protein